MLNIGEGTILAAIVAVSGRSPTILGKPRAPMFDSIRLAFPDVKPNRSIMIGDRYVLTIIHNIPLFFCSNID